ncbi:MAG TPA: TPM domain-containing protein [Dongiaceae bacterium]|nr:TPM domain-containing protein [Dongiaceae bacterium]
MKADEFLKQLRHEDLVAAIQAAEQKTSGEIRLFISHKDVPDAVAAAQAEFERLGMTRTRQRNGVLIFVAPRARKFAVFGDTAVHERCGDAFWQALAAEMSGHFQRGEFTAGIRHGIAKAGELLAVHFPRQSDDRNELPDQVEHD